MLFVFKEFRKILSISEHRFIRRKIRVTKQHSLHHIKLPCGGDPRLHIFLSAVALREGGKVKLMPSPVKTAVHTTQSETLAREDRAVPACMVSGT